MAMLLLVFITPAQAQGPYTQQARDRVMVDGNGRPLSDMERQRRLDRDMEGRGRQMGARWLSDNDGTRYLWSSAEIGKRTQQLQVANHNLQLAMQPTQITDYKRIASYASKVEQLTARLQNQLWIPKAKTQGNPIENGAVVSDEMLRTSVQALDELVRNFLGNEVLQRPSVLSANSLAKAGQDAGALIRESKRVKKMANQLRK